jgi:outer membrane lipase/esterase
MFWSVPMLFPDRTLPTTKKTKTMRRLASRATALLGAALMLAACGGGEQKETFRATRVIVFGDEASTINDGTDVRFPRGSKFTVNVREAGTGNYLCAQNPIWVEAVASLYGLWFSECPSAPPNGAGIMRAKFGDKVADVKTALDTFLAGNALSRTDLVTLMAGTNDVLAQFNARTGANEAALVAAVEQAGTQLGDQVLRVTSLKAKVLISTIPDLSLTPIARTLSGPDQTLLKRLSTRFNDKLRVRLADDPNGGGRSGALLSAVNFGNQFVFTNTSDAACQTTVGTVTTPMATETLPVGCDTQTNLASGFFLWSGATQLSAAAHAALGERAQIRLRNNPL